MKVWIFICQFFVSCCIAEESGQYLLLSSTGIIKIRNPFDIEWTNVQPGAILQERTMLRSNSNSQARIKTPDGRFFTLPQNSQVEIQDLKKRDKYQLMLELTALELQRLPTKKDISPATNPYILHGEDITTISQADIQYIQREEKGAIALFEQGFISGFILKANRMITFFPGYNLSQLKKFLMTAYQMMGMTFHLEKLSNQSN